MKKKIAIILFDLDGVILDSKENMKISWISSTKKYQLKINFNRYFCNIGIPFEDILKKIGINDNINNIKKTYSDTSIKNLNKIKLFKNVSHTIKKLSKNYLLAILTSKDKKRTNLILEKFKLKNKFKLIYCPVKGKKGKPNPWQINHLIKKLKVKKNEVVYVGDTTTDLKTAQNAGINFIYAKYGYEGLKNRKNSLNNISEIFNYIKH